MFERPARSAHRLLLVPAALAATIALTGCTGETDTAGMPLGHSSVGSANPSATSLTGDFNQTDVMFVQDMVPHHQQAIDMSDLLLAKDGVHPEVTALAEQIKSAQQPEIDTMNSWLDAWGRMHVDDGGAHHGGEGGLMTEMQMRQLDKAKATEGQRLFLEGMIRHHQGAVQMAEIEIADGKNEGAVNLAKQITGTQEQEIETMQDLLTKI